MSACAFSREARFMGARCTGVRAPAPSTTTDDYDITCRRPAPWRVHALADLGLGDPAGVDHRLQVVLRDRHRLEEHRADRQLLGAARSRRSRPSRRRASCPPAMLRREGAGRLAELARVLPHRHGLLAARHAVERRDVAVLARHRNADQVLRSAAPRPRRRRCRRWRPPPRRPCCCSWSGSAPCSSARSPAPSRRCTARRRS